MRVIEGEGERSRVNKIQLENGLFVQKPKKKYKIKRGTENGEKKKRESIQHT